MENDAIFLNEALKEATKALKRDEVPVGAIIVKDNKIIANQGINVNRKLIPTNRHFDIGKIYFGIYTLVIKRELLVTEFKHIVVHSLKKEKHTTPTIKYTG